MAGRQELLAGQIDGDLRHKRSWNLREKKEDSDGILFYLLLVPEMHHGGQNLRGEGAGGLLYDWRIKAHCELNCLLMI